MARFVLLSCLLALTTFSNVNSGPVPDMLGEDYEGDIKLTEEQQKYISDVNQGIAPSTGFIDTFRRWGRNLQGNVVVPYRIQATEGFCK